MATFGGMAPEVRRRFDEYEKAHQHPLNRLIHFFCIPGIMFSLVALACAGTHSGNPLWHLGGWVLGFVLASAALHVAGTGGWQGWAACAMTVIFMIVTERMSQHARLSWAAWLFCGGWILQIFGHLVFEQNRPKFLTSFGQAFEAAPLHVFDELARPFRNRR